MLKDEMLTGQGRPRSTQEKEGEMSTKEIHFCDLCALDGEENVRAIGWYIAQDSTDYDVCSKHAKDVKKAGRVLHLY